MNHNKIKNCKLKLRYFQSKNIKISSKSGQVEKKKCSQQPFNFRAETELSILYELINSFCTTNSELDKTSIEKRFLESKELV